MLPTLPGETEAGAQPAAKKFGTFHCGYVFPRYVIVLTVAGTTGASSSIAGMTIRSGSQMGSGVWVARGMETAGVCQVIGWEVGCA